MIARRHKTGITARALSEGGFTLLELVISLVMLGIIMLIISGAMRLGLRSVESAENKIDTIERLRTSMNIVNAQVQSEIPLTMDDNGEKKFYFKGERDSMQLSTNYSIWGGQRGFVVVRYKVESGTGGKYYLSASESPVGVEVGGGTAVLFDNVDSLYFEYFYKDPTQETGNWVETWTDTASIPEKIKLHLVYGKKDFSLIIPMRTPGVLAASAPQPGFTPVKP